MSLESDPAPKASFSVGPIAAAAIGHANPADGARSLSVDGRNNVLRLNL